MRGAGVSALATLLLLGGCAHLHRVGALGRPASPASLPPHRDADARHRQYFDQRRQRYYWFDPVRKRYYWENGSPYP